jgi:hypothetical protein
MREAASVDGAIKSLAFGKIVNNSEVCDLHPGRNTDTRAWLGSMTCSTSKRWFIYEWGKLA